MPDPLREALDPEDPNAFDPSGQEPAAPAVSVPAKPAAPVVGEPPPAVSSRNPDGTFKAKTTEIPPSLRARARDLLRLDDSAIDELSIATLQNMVIGAQELLYRESQQWARRTVAADSSPQHVPEPEEAPFDLGKNEDGTPRREEEFDPTIIKALKDQHVLNQNLAKKLRSQEQRDQDRLSNQIRDTLDDAFATMAQKDSVAEHLFGTGGVADITPEQLAERDRLIRAAKVNVATETARGVAKKLKAARDKFYPAATSPAGQGYAAEGPGDAPATPNANGKPTVEEWNDGALAKPTNRQATEKKHGRARAIEGLVRRRAELRGASTDTAELEGLPE